MNNLKYNKVLIIVLILFMSTGVLSHRLNSYKKYLKRGKATHDENRHMLLAIRLKNNIKNYTLAGYDKNMFAKINKEQIEKDYTKDSSSEFRLYIHPPLFPLFIVASFNLFGKTPVSAAIVPIMFNILTIILIYMTGSLVFNRKTGIFAALFLCFDPINIICSQKIWMSTMLSFWILLSIYLFIYALKKEKSSFYLYSAIASGFAALTKFTGILSLLSVLLYAIIFQKKLLKRKAFISSMLVPFIMLTPFFLWHYSIYGMDFIKRIDDRFTFINTAAGLACFIIVTILVMVIFNTIRKKEIYQKTANYMDKYINSIKYFLIFILIFIFKNDLFTSLNFTYLPLTSWDTKFNNDFNFLFYFIRPIEFSTLYAFGYLSFFIPFNDEKRHSRQLKLAALVILGFYIWWGNFQCRYIISATPFLIILSIHTWFYLWDYLIRKTKYSVLKHIATISMYIIPFYFLLRLMRINILLSYVNNMCYF